MLNDSLAFLHSLSRVTSLCLSFLNVASYVGACEKSLICIIAASACRQCLTNPQSLSPEVPFFSSLESVHSFLSLGRLGLKAESSRQVKNQAGILAHFLWDTSSC